MTALLSIIGLVVIDVLSFTLGFYLVLLTLPLAAGFWKRHYREFDECECECKEDECCEECKAALREITPGRYFWSAQLYNPSRKRVSYNSGTAIVTEPGDTHEFAAALKKDWTKKEYGSLEKAPKDLELRLISFNPLP